MAKVVGIDLGTTNSVVAVVQGPHAEVVYNRDGKDQTRSVVGEAKRRAGKGLPPTIERLVGDVAVDNWPMAPRDTIVSVKRLMGRGYKDKEVQKVAKTFLYEVRPPSSGTADSVAVLLGGKEYSPQEVSAMILQKLKEDAEYRLQQPVTHAVITVPAYFTPVQKAATREAARQAGLEVIRILDEPSAAAIASGLDRQDGNETPTILVFDLGGGTFDVSLLVMGAGTFAQMKLDGNMWLGGDNLDQVIIDRVLRWVQEEFDVDAAANFRFMVELKRGAQKAKERLTSALSARVLVTGILTDEDGNLLDVDLEITRDQFEHDIRLLVGRYKECRCREVNPRAAQKCAECGASLSSSPVKDGETIRIVKRAMESAGLTPDQVDHVLMVGNASSVPLVQQEMEELFGPEKIVRNLHPKHCVAMGAAILATMLGPKVECDCGHLNPDAATHCERCGTSLQARSSGSGSNGHGSLSGDLAASGAIVIIPDDGASMITAHNYGTQTSGDQFNVFIQAGDPYPTPREARQPQTQKTQVPGQRMLSIPVYAGFDLERASENELQGHAFAILPPGLPQNSPVHVTLWLDPDCIFELEARLADGTALTPWILRGGEDAKVIEIIRDAEQERAERAALISAERGRELDAVLMKVFAKLTAKETRVARDEAQRYLQEVSRDVEEPPDLRQKARALVNFTRFLISEYRWAFNPQQIYLLNSLADEVEDALSQDDEVTLKQTVDELEKEISPERLPMECAFMLNCLVVIRETIRPQLPAEGDALEAELSQVNTALQRGSRAQAENALTRFVRHYEDVLNRLPDQPERQSVPCPNPRCGASVLAGAPRCSKCGQDLWITQR